MWELLGSTVDRLAKAVDRRDVRGVLLSLGVIGFVLGSVLLAYLLIRDDRLNAEWFVWMAWVLIVIGLVLLVVAWILPKPKTDLTEPDALAGSFADAIKCASPFTEQDHELFMRLGRGQDIATLKGHAIDRERGLVILKGETGVGKISLLRGGLLPELKKSGCAADCIEIRPGAPVDQLRDLARDLTWQGLTLNQLHSFHRDDGKKVVLLLDQAEQLWVSPPEQRDRVLSVLRRLAESGGPHGVTVILGIRRSRQQGWNDFCDTLAPGAWDRIERVSLERMHSDGAQDVLRTILDEAQIQARPDLVRNLVASVKDKDGRVSPMDLGILAQMVRRLGPERAQGRLNSKAPGRLHTDYLAEVLQDDLSDVLEQSKVLDILGTLADHLESAADGELRENSLRLAEGLTAAEVAGMLPAIDSQRVTNGLERLASPAIRVLERLDAAQKSGPPRYRYVHELMLEAAKNLAAERGSEVQRLSRLIGRRLREWAADSEPASRLLRGRELRSALQHRVAVRAGQDIERYIEQSVRSRRCRRSAAVAAVLVLSLAAALGARELARESQRRQAETFLVFGDEGLPDRHELERWASLSRMPWHARKHAFELALKHEPNNLARRAQWIVHASNWS